MKIDKIKHDYEKQSTPVLEAMLDQLRHDMGKNMEVEEIRIHCGIIKQIILERSN